MRTAQLFGLLLGLLQIGGTLAVYAFGLHAGPSALEGGHRFENIVAFVAMMTCLCLGLRSTARAQTAAGKSFTLGVGAKATFVIASVGGLATFAGQYVYVAVIHPEYSQHLRALYVEKGALTDEQAGAYAGQLDFATSALFRALSQGATTLIFSLFIGLAYAFLFRSPPKASKA